MGTVNLLQVSAMTIPKGGRGKRAPYQTTTVRVPLPILPAVEQLIDQYRQDGNLALDQKIDLEAAIIKTKELLGDKKMNKKVTIQKLLEAIYGEKVSITNL